MRLRDYNNDPLSFQVRPFHSAQYMRRFDPEPFRMPLITHGGNMLRDALRYASPYLKPIAHRAINYGKDRLKLHVDTSNRRIPTRLRDSGTDKIVHRAIDKAADVVGHQLDRFVEKQQKGSGIVKTKPKKKAVKMSPKVRADLSKRLRKKL